MLNFHFGRKYHFVKLENDILGCNSKLPYHSDFQEKGGDKPRITLKRKIE